MSTLKNFASGQSYKSGLANFNPWEGCLSR